MARRVGMEVSIGISEAVSACDVDVISAYPITPQTHVVEHLSEIVAQGRLDAEYISIESEHSAMSACVGAAAAGARTFTATCSQGLALMHEILFIASALRLPIVMAVANRALSAPLNIWNDHSDAMSDRDCGWIQVFAENGQEAFDLTVMAFRIGEDPRVLLPVIVNFDGFILSHVVEPMELLSREEVAKYVPPYVPQIRLDPRAPVTMGPVGIPEIYTETRLAHDHVLRESKATVEEAFAKFAEMFGRQYRSVETYRAEDADVLLLTMGGISETAMSAMDRLREQGKSVGLVRLRLWRPFPFGELAAALEHCKVLAVVDRALSTGGPGGPVASEVKAALYHQANRPTVVEFIAGLGGRDVRVEDFFTIYEKAAKVLAGGTLPPFEIIGVRS